MKSGWIAACLVVGVLSFVAAVDDAPRRRDERFLKVRVDPRSGHFVDSANRVRIFHGMNAVMKGPPYYPDLFKREQTAKDMKDMGLNLVRLGTMWTGWQPEGPGGANESYVQDLEEIMRTLERNGIYVLMDVHQDVLWEETGQSGGDVEGYWGVPPWIKDKLLPEIGESHRYPWPLKGDLIRWECGYFTEKISMAFDAWYNNKAGTADDFANFWTSMVKRMMHKPNVLGYELLNEPFMGNIFEKGHEKMLPGVAGHKNLLPFFNKLHDAIRRVDNDTMVFWEPVVYSVIFPVQKEWNDEFLSLLRNHGHEILPVFLELYCGDLEDDFSPEKANLSTEDHSQDEHDYPVWGPGFTEPLGGPDYTDRSVFSWHYYCWVNDLQNGEEGDLPYNPVYKKFCDDLLGPLVFSTAKMRNEEIRGGRMLTEFGLCTPAMDKPGTQGTEECLTNMKFADEQFESWTFWHSDDVWNDNGDVLLNIAQGMARPYAVATVGIPQKMAFDPWTRVFEYSFMTDPEADVELMEQYPTEIAVPPLVYPDGKFKVEVSPGLIWRVGPVSLDDYMSVIHIFYNPSTAGLATIKIYP